MSREYIYALFAFALGASAGVLAVSAGHEPELHAAESNRESLPVTGLDPRSPAVFDYPAKKRNLPKATAFNTVGDAVSNQPGLRFELMESRWASLREELAKLQRRVVTLEQQAASLPPAATGQDAEAGFEEEPEVLPIETPEQQLFALENAGVPYMVADDLVRQLSQLELERLELRDQAIREGWNNSRRYFEEVRALNDQGIDVRSEIGDEAYDKYLYRTGESNRIQVRSVMQDSTAQLSGVLPGDIIESYGSKRILTFQDLQTVTTQGVRGELIPLELRRGAERVMTWVSRGPLGVRIETAQMPPDS